MNLVVRSGVEGTPQPELALALHICSDRRRSSVTRVADEGPMTRRGMPMVGKRTLTALCCASALLLTGAGTALAADDGVPYKKLVEVTVPNQDAVDSVVEHYDAAEYKRVEDDGIVLNVFASNEEHRRAEGRGLHDRRARSRTPTPARSAWSSARRPSTRRPSPPTSPRTACPRAARSSRASPSSRRRATRSSSARTRSPTSSARPAAPRRRASSTSRPSTSRPRSPAPPRSPARPWRSPTRAPTASTTRPRSTWAASSTPIRRRTSTCTTGS